MHGLPIRPAFSDARASQDALRKRLGMDRHLPAVLLVGAPTCLAECPRGLVQSQTFSGCACNGEGTQF